MKTAALRLSEGISLESGYTLELYSYIYSKSCIKSYSRLLRLAIYLLYTNFCTGWDGLYVGHQRANFGPQQINYDSRKFFVPEPRRNLR
jgi:hypothetical protein